MLCSFYYNSPKSALSSWAEKILYQCQRFFINSWSKFSYSTKTLTQKVYFRRHKPVSVFKSLSFAFCKLYEINFKNLQCLEFNEKRHKTNEYGRVKKIDVRKWRSNLHGTKKWDVSFLVFKLFRLQEECIVHFRLNIHSQLWKNLANKMGSQAALPEMNLSIFSETEMGPEVKWLSYEALPLCRIKLSVCPALGRSKLSKVFLST